MDQIIIEHYKNSCNFLPLENFKIPFIFDNGLYFNKQQVFKYNLLEEEILINGKSEGHCVSWYENRTKRTEGNYKYGKKEGLSIFWHENGQKKLEKNWKYGNEEGLSTSWDENGKLNASNRRCAKRSERNFKNGELEGIWTYWDENRKNISILNFNSI